MNHLIVGVCQVTLLLRHARTLKDKRHVMKSLSERLRNRGFSVSEYANADVPRHGNLGFAYVGGSQTAVLQAIDEGMRLFVGDFEVLDANRDVFDYTEREDQNYVSPEADKYLGDNDDDR